MALWKILGSLLGSLLHTVRGGALYRHSKWFVALLLTSFALILSGCGFHLPNQDKLNETMPELNVIGDYHHPFYKMVVNRLAANGVQVYAQDSSFEPDLKQPIPSLMLPAPQVRDEVVSVNSRAQSIESSILVSIAATLNIPNHRPILMRNSITRSALNKPGQSLASDTEKAMVITETYAQLADELVLRLSYLGRSSDPDAYVPQPSELTFIPSEDDPNNLKLMQQQTSGLTLMEALQLQNQYESVQGQSVSYDQLNNGQSIMQGVPSQQNNTLNRVANQTPATPDEKGKATIIVPEGTEYKLPPVQPERLHTAPSHLY